MDIIDGGIGDFPIDSPGGNGGAGELVVSFQEGAATVENKQIADFIQYLLKQTASQFSKALAKELMEMARMGQPEAVRRALKQALAEQTDAPVYPIIRRWVNLEG